MTPHRETNEQKGKRQMNKTQLHTWEISERQ